MNIRNSGKIPDRIKKIAAVITVLSITLCTGCVSSETSSTVSEQISDPISSSEDNSTHIPTEDSADSGNNTDSSDVFESSDDLSGTSSADSLCSSTDSSDTDSSEDSSDITESSGSSSTVEPTVSGTMSESSLPINSQPVSESISEPVSDPNSTPDPPSVVVIPDFPVPTSPGTMCETSAKGSIDYSNASQGYISARYTGSSNKVKLRIVSGSQKYDHDLSPNQITEFYPLSFGGGEYTVTIYEYIPSIGRYGEAMSCKFSANTNSQLPFLYPNRYSKYDHNSSCVYKAAEVCAGKTASIDKIAAIFCWVTDNITYDHQLSATVQTGYVPDPDRTYNSRTGICFDYASLMCAMLRSQSIPTRLVIGYASPDIYHAWNEVYTEETGWIAPELMLKNAGYNIVDSTFYASAGDKSQIAAYISNSSNYMVTYYY